MTARFDLFQQQGESREWQFIGPIISHLSGAGDCFVIPPEDATDHQAPSPAHITRRKRRQQRRPPASLQLVNRKRSRDDDDAEDGERENGDYKRARFNDEVELPDYEDYY